MKINSIFSECVGFIQLILFPIRVSHDIYVAGDSRNPAFQGIPKYLVKRLGSAGLRKKPTICPLSIVYQFPSIIGSHYHAVTTQLPRTRPI